MHSSRMRTGHLLTKGGMQIKSPKKKSKKNPKKNLKKFKKKIKKKILKKNQKKKKGPRGVSGLEGVWSWACGDPQTATAGVSPIIQEGVFNFLGGGCGFQFFGGLQFFGGVSPIFWGVSDFFLSFFNFFCPKKFFLDALPPRWSMCSRYASYWNAFLFKKKT